jgi:hypothetical protein
MIGTGSIEWRAPDITIPDPWSQKLQGITQELYAGLFCCLASHIAYRICQLAFFKVVFIASLGYVATSIARKVFEDYTYCRKCELAAIRLVQDMPAIKPLITIVAALFYAYFRTLGVAMSVGLGILQGLTNESSKMRYLTDVHRARVKQKQDEEAAKLCQSGT